MTLTPGTKLGPYEILSPIGAGGMGEVWKARDTRLGRIVAIKKVKEQHSERFKQEARSIAALNHPNICQLHDIGEDYLVLEYVEGKPLSSPLPEKEAVRLAIQIATALEAAHKKGIIHRDLKPANIMVTDEGSVKLLDFGLAKLYEQDASLSTSPTADFPATQAGAVLGTVAYMSPEQAQGQPADARSDIFSFGLVLYEMLSGRRAFSGDSTPAVMAALLRDDPPVLQVSRSLEKIVRRCLAKEPAGRYQRISDVKTALEQAFEEIASKSVAEPLPSIAVLPFVDMSPGRDNDWFGDGLSEEIINALTQIPGLKVIARTSSFSFRGKETDIAQIRDRLKVQNILEGSVRKSGNRIRVTAQLIDTADESHLWSERYDREMTDVFAIQDEVCQAIVDKLRIKLSAGYMPVKPRPKNVEAYSFYLRGQYCLTKSTPEGFAKSKEYFEQAIAADPSYALAWHGLALYCWLMGYRGYMRPREANEKCRRAALKALDLDGTLPEAHSVMAILQSAELDWRGAERQFRRALELDPESVDAWMSYSRFYLVPMNRLDEAVSAIRRAIDLDPVSAFLQYELGHRYWLLRQYDRAIEQFLSAIEINPQFDLAHMLLGYTYTQIGRFDEGIRACRNGLQYAPQNTILMGMLGSAYALAGRVDEARKLLEEMHSLAEKTFVPPVGFAYVHIAIGEIDKGFDYLEIAVDERDSMVFHIYEHPQFRETLRSHPRYHALLRKMNLEP
jgi:eukaryotic-like serine/threonine-protein kinase